MGGSKRHPDREAVLRRRRYACSRLGQDVTLTRELLIRRNDRGEIEDQVTKSIRCSSSQECGPGRCVHPEVGGLTFHRHPSIAWPAAMVALRVLLIAPELRFRQPAVPIPTRFWTADSARPLTPHSEPQVHEY